jgi:hypothetical protein
MKVAFALFTVLVVTGCTVSMEPAETESPVTTSVPPLHLADAPAWTTTTTDFPGEPSRVDLRDGKALVVGRYGFQVIDTDSGVAVATVTTETDLGDGARWDETAGSPFFAGEGVVVPYRRDGEVGLAKLVGGDVVWLGRTFGAGGVLRSADDDTAMVTVASPDDPDRVVEQADLRMIAFDSRSGDRRWERTGGWPVTVADGLVLTVSGARLDNDTDPDGRVVMSALDVSTGEPRWSLGDRYNAIDVVTTAGDAVLVTAIAKGETARRLVVLSVKTGERLGDLGAATEVRCATDEERMIACGHVGDSVSVFDLATEKVVTVPCPDGLEAVGPDRLVVAKPTGRRYTVDLAGRTIDRELPESVWALTGTQLVVHAHHTVSGYRIS